MRILAIDAGNTRIKWGMHDDGSWEVQGWVESARAPRLARAWVELQPPQGVIAANVAGARVAASIAAAARPFRRRVAFVKSAAHQCGVRNSYERPAQLGPDRWAALIGARGLHRGACVVVSAGTTVTVDALTADGVFLGGTIIAGAELMRDALSRRTARLKPQRGRYAYFPACTADAIESGAANALAGAVDRMQRFMREAGEEAPLIMVSGGGARALAPQLNGTVEVVDNLVLEGLVRMAHEGGGVT